MDFAYWLVQPQLWGDTWSNTTSCNLRGDRDKTNYLLLLEIVVCHLRLLKIRPIIKGGWHTDCADSS
ncbi:MAG: hypothetical protein KME55_15365 [Nostoc indistinguendum CM1-VF10]|nr:hypothetical protein [Nostoc indistinguendum CM1-VF10]